MVNAFANANDAQKASGASGKGRVRRRYLQAGLGAREREREPKYGPIKGLLRANLGSPP